MLLAQQQFNPCRAKVSVLFNDRNVSAHVAKEYMKLTVNIKIEMSVGILTHFGIKMPFFWTKFSACFVLCSHIET